MHFSWPTFCFPLVLLMWWETEVFFCCVALLYACNDSVDIPVFVSLFVSPSSSWSTQKSSQSCVINTLFQKLEPPWRSLSEECIFAVLHLSFRTSFPHKYILATTESTTVVTTDSTTAQTTAETTQVTTTQGEKIVATACVVGYLSLSLSRYSTNYPQHAASYLFLEQTQSNQKPISKMSSTNFSAVSTTDSTTAETTAETTAATTAETTAATTAETTAATTAETTAETTQITTTEGKLQAEKSTIQTLIMWHELVQKQSPLYFPMSFKICMAHQSLQLPAPLTPPYQ